MKEKEKVKGQKKLKTERKNIREYVRDDRWAK